jgi:hypothetical protein
LFTKSATILILNHAQMSLVYQIFGAIDTRVNDYIEAGALTDADVEVIEHVLAIGEQGELWQADAAGRAILRKVVDAEDWPEVCGWDETETNAWRSLREAIID